jgi:hypothetical protein
MAIYNEAQAKGIPYKGVLLDVSNGAAHEAGTGAAKIGGKCSSSGALLPNERLTVPAH